jgi:glycosyltransferase involved in cell wall biosynthesis
MGDVFRSFRRIQRKDPDVVIVVQGSIEISSVGLMASRLAGCRTVSYIPLAQTRREMKSSLALLRDFVNRFYYLLPDRFVTISRSQEGQLRRRGIPEGRVAVVHNFIDVGRFRRIEKRSARAMLGLDEGAFLFATLWRVVFKQKGQDILIRAIRMLGEAVKETRFLIVGDGPDVARAQEMIREFRLTGLVRTLPWQSSPDVVYSALDAVVLPSLFEGVPLVMIEAVHYRLPVIASRIDGFSEFLPEEWLFPAGDEAALAARIRKIMGRNQTTRVDEVHREFQGKFHRDTAHLEFLDAVRNGQANR